MTQMTRPRERNGMTQKFVIGGEALEGYLTINVDEDGRPFEIFIVCSKQGSLVRGMSDSLVVLISHALQSGVEGALYDVVDALTGITFEPKGTTGDPEVPTCKSLSDYVARKLGTYLTDEQRAALNH